MEIESWGSSAYIDKTNFKTDSYKRQKRTWHNVKGSVPEEDKTAVNMHAPKTEAPQYISQISAVIKEDDSDIIIGGDFNDQIMSKDRSSWE